MTKLGAKWGVTFRRKFDGKWYAYWKSGTKTQAQKEARSMRDSGIPARIIKSADAGEWHVYTKER